MQVLGSSCKALFFGNSREITQVAKLHMFLLQWSSAFEDQLWSLRGSRLCIHPRLPGPACECAFADLYPRILTIQQQVTTPSVATIPRRPRGELITPPSDRCNKDIPRQQQRQRSPTPPRISAYFFHQYSDSTIVDLLRRFLKRRR